MGFTVSSGGNYKMIKKYFLALEDLLCSRISVIDNNAFNMSKERLCGLMKKEHSLDDVLNTVFNYSGYLVYRSIRPQQVQVELKRLANKVDSIRPLNILEVGTYTGGSLYVWARHFKSCQKIISIDLPVGLRARKWAQSNIKFFKLFDEAKQLYFLRENSHNAKTVAKVSEILGPEPIDFLFIDGDHSYNGVRQDFENYRQFMRPGGIVAFHDIVNSKLEVSKFWTEVKSEFKSEEIVGEDLAPYGIPFGIGIIYM
jgi:predicted O-methyltransferase YrrM